MEDLINRVTKKSTALQDYTLLEATLKKATKALNNSRSILGGCAYGGAHRGYHSAMNAEMKLWDKVKKIEKSIEAKYKFSFNKDGTYEDDINYCYTMLVEVV